MHRNGTKDYSKEDLNPLNTELNPICHLLALLEAHHILHVSRIRVIWREFNIKFSRLGSLKLVSNCVCVWVVRMGGDLKLKNITWGTSAAT